MLALQSPVTFLLICLLCVNELQQGHAMETSGENLFTNQIYVTCRQGVFLGQGVRILLISLCLVILMYQSFMLRP